MKKLFIHNPIFRITAPPVYGVLVYLLILLVNNNLNELSGIFSNKYLFRENTQLVERENRLREKVEADFTTFKNDINPDLLYESLEVILQTLHHDVHTSEEQIDLLAGVYRYQLMNRDKELVAVTEELAALHDLKSLLNFRFGQQITLTSKLASLGEAY